MELNACPTVTHELANVLMVFAVWRGQHISIMLSERRERLFRSESVQATKGEHF